MSDVEMRGGTFDADGNKTDHAAVALHVGTADAAPGDVEGLLLVDGVYKMPKTPAHHNRSDDVDPSHPKNGRTRVSKIDIKKEGLGTKCCCFFLADSLTMTFNGPYGTQTYKSQGDPQGELYCFGLCKGKPKEEVVFTQDGGTKQFTYNTLAKELDRAINGPNVETGKMHSWCYSKTFLWCFDCCSSGNYWYKCCVAPGCWMEMRSYAGVTSAPNKLEPMSTLYRQNPFGQRCCSDSVLQAYVTNGKDGSEEEMIAAIRYPVGSLCQQSCVGPCNICCPCICGPNSVCIPMACSHGSGCCYCQSCECTIAPPDPPDFGCCDYLKQCRCLPDPCVGCCCPCAAGTKGGCCGCGGEGEPGCCGTTGAVALALDECCVSICSSPSCSMVGCPACVAKPWCCDPCGNYRLEIPSGNYMLWATPAGEKYLQIAEVDHVIEGHNLCCWMLTTADVALEVSHWDDASSEAAAMSVLPFWEIFHSGPTEVARMRTGLTKSSFEFDLDGKVVDTDTRQRMRMQSQSAHRAAARAAAKKA